MRKLATAAAALLALAGCSSAPDLGPVFDDEGRATTLTCIKHQPAGPGPRYTDPAHRETGETLAVLKYYTQYGKTRYCDGTPPTDTDRAWARLYTELGADRANVAAILG
ncbi:hypothetical protein [Alloactinosynnema sp. L-07]|uniref:hypothetical protein n=1 Tax=Alloactinosynnema sp. L-07 TaxID=1653480 RepID=UPI00065EF32B|nr:hypothetical protein [Alloactinosynnema sp. L-07]CRK57947.1 hypothetical protein [Alloactinosynnema sp. L-07]